MRISTIQRSDLEETLIELNRWKRGRQWGSMPVQLDGRWPLQFGIWLREDMSVGQSNFFIRRKGLQGRCSREVAQIDPLRIEGPIATLVASQSRRRVFS